MNSSAPRFSTLAVTTVTRIEQTSTNGKVRFRLDHPVCDNPDCAFGAVGFDVYALPVTFTIGEKVLMEVTFREILPE